MTTMEGGMICVNSKKYADQGKAWLEYLEALKG